MKAERSSKIIMAIAAIVILSLGPSAAFGTTGQGYSFMPAQASENGSNYSFPMYLEELNNTTLANITTTRALVSNMSLQLADLKAIPLTYSVRNITAGYFVVSFTLDQQERDQINNGSFILIASSYTLGNNTFQASGIIKASLFPAAPQAWYEKYLGFKSAPPGNFQGDATWLFLSIPALSSYGILGTLIVIYYLNKIRLDLRDGKRNREKEEREEERGRKIDDMHDKIDRIYDKVMKE